MRGMEMDGGRGQALGVPGWEPGRERICRRQTRTTAYILPLHTEGCSRQWLRGWKEHFTGSGLAVSRPWRQALGTPSASHLRPLCCPWALGLAGLEQVKG